MEIVSVIIGVLTVASLGLAVRNRYWGKPKTKKVSHQTTNPAESQVTQTSSIKSKKDTPLQSNDWRVRLEALNTFDNTQDKEALSQVVQLLNDEDDDVCQEAKHILMEHGELVTDDVIMMLQNGGQNARIATAEILAEWAKPTTIDALKNGLSDHSKWVRIPVLEALIAIGNKEAIEAIGIALKDEDITVKSLALDALRGINTYRTRQIMFEAGIR